LRSDDIVPTEHGLDSGYEQEQLGLGYVRFTVTPAPAPKARAAPLAAAYAQEPTRSGTGRSAGATRAVAVSFKLCAESAGTFTTLAGGMSERTAVGLLADVSRVLGLVRTREDRLSTRPRAPAEHRPLPGPPRRDAGDIAP
jgi:hypothetical protein